MDHAYPSRDSPIPIVETEHLSREVRGLRIVEDVTVDVLASELPAVVRPSGTGKSSFLRLLT